MKSFLLGLGLLICMQARAAVIVESPVNLSASVLVSGDPSFSDTAVKVIGTTTTFTTKQVIQEGVDRGLIPSVTGWSLVCYYDAQMDGIYTGSEPKFRFRHTDGRLVDATLIISVEPFCSAANGTAKIAGTKVTGSLARKSLYALILSYQGKTAICYGVAQFTLAVSGTRELYTGISTPVTMTFNGYISDDYESVVTVKMTLPGFKRK
jgi:hypothetical protein